MSIGWFRSRLRYLAGAALIALAASPTAAQEPVKLHFWDMIWGPPDTLMRPKAWWTNSIKLIQDSSRISVGALEQLVSNLPDGGGAGTAPDVSTGAGYQSVQLYDQGAIRPVDDVIAELKKERRVRRLSTGLDRYASVQRSLRCASLGGRYPGLVLPQRSARGGAPAAPTNWDEFAKVAKATTGNGKYGLVNSGDTGGSQIIYTVILNNGGGLFSPDRKLALMSDRNVEAVTALANMVKDGSVSPASAGYSYDDARSAFQRGEAAFMLDTPGAIDSAPDAVKPKIGILPPPTAPHGDKGTVYWINNIMIYTQSKHPEEVKAFMLWWSKNQKPLWTKGIRRSFQFGSRSPSTPTSSTTPRPRKSSKSIFRSARPRRPRPKGFFLPSTTSRARALFRASFSSFGRASRCPDMFSTARARLKAVLKE